VEVVEVRKILLPAAALAGIAAAMLLSSCGGSTALTSATTTLEVSPASHPLIVPHSEHAAVAATGTLQVSIIANTSSTLTVAWTPPTGIVGYEFKVDGARVSNTWNAAQSTTKFKKLASPPAHDYQVVPLVEGVAGSVTYPPPPPPVTTTATTTTAPTTTTTPAPPPASMPQQGISMPLGNITGKSSADQDWMLDQIVALGNGHPMFLRTDWWPGNAGFQALAPKIAARPSIVLMPLLSYDASNRPTQSVFATQAGQLAQLGYRYIDILNEPDMSGWTPQDAAAYFTAAKAAIKAVNPNAVVIGPSTWKTTSQNPADGFAWDKAFLQAGGRPDVFDKHLYGYVSGDRSWNNWAWLPDERAALDADGLTNVPIMATEAGDNADRNGTAAQNDAVATGMCARDKGCVSHGYTVTVPIISFVDYSLLNDASPGGFGLLDNSRNQRPAYQTFEQNAR
jgi:hypothetical protein